MKTIKDMAIEYGWKHGDEYRQDYASLAFSFEQGAKAMLEKASEWLKDFCIEHYIMRYSDCSEVDEKEIVEIFRKKMEE